MKRKIFMACAALVVSAAAAVGVKAYNYYSMPELMRANLEALTSDEHSSQIGYVCRCSYDKSSKGCKSDHAGNLCAPSGTAKCWKYDSNCSNL